MLYHSHRTMPLPDLPMPSTKAMKGGRRLPTVVIDSREQAPLPITRLTHVRAGLATGDYSVLGLEDTVAIERKSLDDLAQCCGNDRDRFERELQRMMAYRVRALVIEGTVEDINMRCYRSQIEPKCITGSLLAWRVRYGIEPHFFRERDVAARWVERECWLAAREAVRAWNRLATGIRKGAACES